MASPELVVAASLPKKRDGRDANVEIRGVGERAWDLRPNVKIIAGRKLKPGLSELLIGARVHERFAGTEVGSTLQMRGQQAGPSSVSSIPAMPSTPRSGVMLMSSLRHFIVKAVLHP